MSTLEVPRPVAGRILRPFGLPVRVSPLALVLLAVLGVSGFLANTLAVDVARPLLSLPVPTMTGALGTAAFASTVIVAIVLHETGHALVGRLVGHRLLWVTVGATPSVRLDGEPVGARRVAISAAGPIIEAAFGAAIVLAATAGDRTWIEPCALGGWFAAATGSLGLLVPLTPNSDARKVWRGIGQILRVLPLPPATRHRRG